MFYLTVGHERDIIHVSVMSAQKSHLQTLSRDVAREEYRKNQLLESFIIYFYHFKSVACK
jgi:hypothetical protein